VTKNNMTVVSHPIALLGPLQLFTFSRHFDRIEVIEAELQAVLNTLTKHDFYNAFKKWQKRWEQCICTEGDYFEGDGGQ
jgi:hypothetical protein